jgi:hypothetical protein
MRVGPLFPRFATNARSPVTPPILIRSLTSKQSKRYTPPQWRELSDPPNDYSCHPKKKAIQCNPVVRVTFFREAGNYKSDPGAPLASELMPRLDRLVRGLKKSLGTAQCAKYPVTPTRLNAIWDAGLIGTDWRETGVQDGQSEGNGLRMSVGMRD